MQEQLQQVESKNFAKPKVWYDDQWVNISSIHMENGSFYSLSIQNDIIKLSQACHP